MLEEMTAYVDGSHDGSNSRSDKEMFLMHKPLLYLLLGVYFSMRLRRRSVSLDEWHHRGKLSLAAGPHNTMIEA